MGNRPYPDRQYRDILWCTTFWIEQITDNTTERHMLEALHHSAREPIHPIFCRCRWYKLEPTDYARMLPAFVLATRLLECHRASHFWHALLAGPQKEVVDHLGHLRGVFGLHETQDENNDMPLPQEAQTAVDSFLEESLPGSVTLLTFEKLESRGVAIWEPALNVRGAALFEPAPNLAIGSPQGGNCLIAIDSALVEDLHCKDTKHKWIFRKWFELATTLVHEVAHAACMMLRGPDQEMFFGDHQFIEMGFALETCIFGGAALKGQFMDCPLFFREMPDAGLSFAYEYNPRMRSWPMRASPAACLKNELVKNVAVNLYTVQRMILGQERKRFDLSMNEKTRDSVFRRVNEMYLNHYAKWRKSKCVEDVCDDGMEDDEAFAMAMRSMKVQ